jgi:MoxR-like ATPase
MQERQVTLGRESLPLPSPFHVFATQNPIEQEGTYPLPEAQLDRFLLKLLVSYPEREEEEAIVRMVTEEEGAPEVETLLSGDALLALQRQARGIFVEDRLVRYATELVQITRRTGKASVPSEGAEAGMRRLELAPFIELGASPRASIALIQSARAQALLDGRNAVLPDDLKAVAPAVLRHRILLTYYADAEGISTDRVVEEVLATVPAP